MSSGVSKYIKATATIWFPDGHICCDLCPMLETYARRQCRCTGEYLLDTKTIGYDCPLTFTDEEFEEVQESEEI